MKFAARAWQLLVVVPFVAGCAGFWQSPDSSSSSDGCTSDCTTASSGNFYILNNTSSPEIVGEYFNSGALTGISGSPWTVPSTPYSMAIAPSGDYLYVSTTAGVYVYSISGGELGSDVEVSEDAAALAIAVDTTGDWLIEAVQGTDTVTMAAIPISSSTGEVNGTEETATYSVSNAAVQTGKIAVSEDDKFIFVALGTGGTIAVPFTASAANPFGSSAYTVPVLHSGGAALSVAVDPSDRLFYIGETLGNTAATSGGLRVFEYSSLGSTLVQASGSPIASGGLSPRAIQPGSSGTYVYVGNGEGSSTDGNITSFLITEGTSSYTVSTGDSVTAGILPYSLAIDSTDTFLLDVNNVGGPYFDSYTFDSSTAGELDVQVVADTGTSPLAIVAAP